METLICTTCIAHDRPSRVHQDILYELPVSHICWIYPKRKSSLCVIFFNDLLDIIISILFIPHFPLLSFTATASPLPAHITWRPWSVWPPCHRTSIGLKTEDLGPCGRRNGPEHSKLCENCLGKNNGTILKRSSPLK